MRIYCDSVPSLNPGHAHFPAVCHWFDSPHQEHLDYEIVQSLNPEFNKAVIRVNVFREHRQTLQVRRALRPRCV